MKPSSISMVAMATTLLVLCTSFYSGKKALPGKQMPATNLINYYWYTNGGTQYDGWFSLQDEEIRMENLYGVDVDTYPSGTIVAQGYALKGYPHLIFASYYLYAHF